MRNARDSSAVTASMGGLSHGVQDVLPLGEALERCVRIYAHPVSHSERQRAWDEENDRADKAWLLEEHRKALEQFKAACAARRGRPQVNAVTDGDSQVAEQQ